MNEKFGRENEAVSMNVPKIKNKNSFRSRIWREESLFLQN